jgi:predicted cupin superfamily sugar epimerase
VIIHADEVASASRPGGYNPSTSSSSDSEGDEQSFWTGGKARVETFVVGGDVLAGERLQWIVEGGKYKASFLLEDKDASGGGKGEGTGCLISETVVPGFEYEDHDFLKRERAEVLLTKEQLEEMGWMLRVD